MILEIPVVIVLLAAFGLLAWRRVGMLAWALAWWIGFFVFVRFGFAVPIPMSVVMMYMGIATIALFTYVTSSAERREAIAGPIVRLITDDRQRLPLIGITLLIPALAAGGVYMRMSQPVEAPYFSRTIHPASPATIDFKDKKIDIDNGENPFRELEKSNPDGYKQHVASGREVYYRNCHFCHGDDLAGDGMFVHGLNPIPTNFTDAGTIPMLRETFLFWRIAKGGPGLPDEGGPWDSPMPMWERFLTEDDIWNVILYLYDHTGSKPRAKEGGEP